MAELGPRWTKLARDVAAERGRVALMVAAIAVSLAGVGAVLGGSAVLRRELAACYGATRPAAATLELPGGADAGAVALARGRPGVADAEAREVVVARARVGGDWRRLLLFVIDDFADVRLNRFSHERGAWPPPDGAMLVERSALGMLAADVGTRVRVKTAHGDEADLEVAGVVHDPALAPGWQERSGYGYVTRATLARLGEPPILGELRIALAGDPRDPAVVEAAAAEVGRRLAEAGHPVRALHVPPPGQHPHQRQMETVLAMMLAFAGLALVLSAVLVASALSSLLARQVREIAVMKTLGATAGQVARLYAALTGAAGAAAVLVAMPAGVHGARALAAAVARLLNLTLESERVPPWVFVVQAVAGIAVPLAVAACPIRRASRRSVRDAIDDHGVASEAPRPPWTAALPAPLRSALRRPGRLALTVALLAAGGAMALTADQVSRGWEASVARGFAVRSYDGEVLLAAPSPAALAARVAAVPGVRAVEGWGWAPAAFAVPGRIDVTRSYPDRGHGALVAMGVPPDTALIRLPLRAGRWLTAEDRGGDALVLNHGALALAPGLRVGDPVDLSIEGRVTRWRLVGVVEEIGAPGIAYAADAAFGRAVGTGAAVRLLRVATAAETPAGRARILREVDAALERARAPVQSILPLTELRSAMGDHILVLVRTLTALAAILGAVGLIGLVSALGTSVVERTREVAILKALGATPRRIARLFVAEGLAIAALGLAAGLALSLPLTLLVGAVVGRLGFLAPLPLVFSPRAALATLVAAAAGTLLATLVPARRAAGLSIREALGRV